MNTKRYTEQEFIEAVKTSTSYRQVLTKLGLVEAGGNYHTIKKQIKVLGLDASHFTHQSWSKDKIIGPKRPIEDYLSNKFNVNSHDLKKRLLSEKFFEHKCCNCNLVEWLGSLIPLELHHIDGNNKNNSLSNMQLLCPNCHALTPNYRGKNKKYL